MIDRFGKCLIPLTQTSAAHVVLAFLILTNIDSNFEMMCLLQAHICTTETLHVSFEGVSFKLTSSWPPARGRGVASCGPDATSGGSGGSAGDFREAIFYTQARANKHICSELGVQFSTNLRKSPWPPQGTPRDPQGDPNL